MLTARSNLGSSELLESCNSAQVIVTKFFGPMNSFFASKNTPSGASSSSAAQPAGESASGDGAHKDAGSAEQLAVKLECLKDVRRWMATPEILNTNLDIGLVKEAVVILSRVPRPRQEDVQPLLSKRGVAQFKERKNRPLAEVIGELEQRVVNAAQTLQAQLANNAGKLATVAPASAAQPAVSCVTIARAASCTAAGSAGDDPFLAELKRRQQKRATQSETEEQRPLQNPKPHRDRTNEAHVIPLANMKNLL